MELENVSITWFGHASFLIESSGLHIYIDPYVLPDRPEPADLILVTHEHFDHCAPDNIRKILKGETIVLTSEGAKDKCPGNVKAMQPGDSVNVYGVDVRAVWAYNIGKSFHPKGFGLGFVIDIAGQKIYHAGDTDVIPEMRDLANLNIDLALLPVGGTYTMGLEDALEAIRVIRPKKVVPMHYNYLEGLDLSDVQLEEFKKQVEDLGVECILLKPELGKK